MATEFDLSKIKIDLPDGIVQKSDLILDEENRKVKFIVSVEKEGTDLDVSVTYDEEAPLKVTLSGETPVGPFTIKVMMPTTGETVGEEVVEEGGSVQNRYKWHELVPEKGMWFGFKDVSDSDLDNVEKHMTLSLEWIPFDNILTQQMIDSNVPELLNPDAAPLNRLYTYNDFLDSTKDAIYIYFDDDIKHLRTTLWNNPSRGTGMFKPILVPVSKNLETFLTASMITTQRFNLDNRNNQSLNNDNFLLKLGKYLPNVKTISPYILFDAYNADGICPGVNAYPFNTGDLTYAGSSYSMGDATYTWSYEYYHRNGGFNSFFGANEMGYGTVASVNEILVIKNMPALRNVISFFQYKDAHTLVHKVDEGIYEFNDLFHPDAKDKIEQFGVYYYNRNIFSSVNRVNDNTDDPVGDIVVNMDSFFKGKTELKRCASLQFATGKGKVTFKFSESCFDDCPNLEWISLNYGTGEIPLSIFSKLKNLKSLMNLLPPIDKDNKDKFLKSELVHVNIDLNKYYVPLLNSVNLTSDIINDDSVVIPENIVIVDSLTLNDRTPSKLSYFLLGICGAEPAVNRPELLKYKLWKFSDTIDRSVISLDCSGLFNGLKDTVSLNMVDELITEYIMPFLIVCDAGGLFRNSGITSIPKALIDGSIKFTSDCQLWSMFVGSELTELTMEFFDNLKNQGFKGKLKSAFENTKLTHIPPFWEDEYWSQLITDTPSNFRYMFKGVTTADNYADVPESLK